MPQPRPSGASPRHPALPCSVTAPAAPCGDDPLLCRHRRQTASSLRTGPCPVSVSPWWLGRSPADIWVEGPVTISATWPDGSGARTAVKSAAASQKLEVAFSRQPGGGGLHGAWALRPTAHGREAPRGRVPPPTSRTRVSLSGPGPQSTSPLAAAVLDCVAPALRCCRFRLPGVFSSFFLSPSILKTIH